MWFLASRKARSKTALRPRRGPYRPLLETLEDRTVPASLSYSTYLNSTVYATAVDSAGDIYVTGRTGSTLTTTPGAFQTTGSGGAFVAKLNPNGTALIYATYLGNGGDGGTGIAVDAAGDAYVIAEGGTIPTTANAIASSPNSYDSTDFVAELNPTGSGLNYATYLPGTLDGLDGSYSLAGAIAVDGSGNIYADGFAGTGLPVTAGAYQTSPGGAFFMKINPALSGTASVLYATYLGSSASAATATGIAVDGAGDAYLEGYTYPGFPTTSGAFQTMTATGGAFVAKLNPALSGEASLVYSTYLGGTTTAPGVLNLGSGDVPDTPLPGLVVAEITGGIAVDSAGNAYVTSGTSDTDFPTTSGAYQTNSNIYVPPTSHPQGYPVTETDVFVTKLNATGSALVYSTYLGGGTNVTSVVVHHKTQTQITGTRSGGTSIAVDANGDAHVTGWTNSTVFPTVNALQTTNAGGFDAFVTVLNPTGSGLLFSSYFGGGGTDYGYGLALDAAGNAYVGGQTNSSNFPTTAGAYQTTPGGGFALKIDPPADISEVSIPISTGGTIAAAGSAPGSGIDDLLLARYAQSMTAGSSVPRTASNISLAEPNSTLTPVAFSVLLNGTQTSPDIWTFTLPVNLPPDTCTLFAPAEDSAGVFADLATLTLAVQ
jgi:hypothetical protein